MSVDMIKLMLKVADHLEQNVLDCDYDQSSARSQKPTCLLWHLDDVPDGILLNHYLNFGEFFSVHAAAHDGTRRGVIEALRKKAKEEAGLAQR